MGLISYQSACFLQLFSLAKVMFRLSSREVLRGIYDGKVLYICGAAQGSTMYFSRCFGIAPSNFFSVNHFFENSLSAYRYAPSHRTVTTV